MAGPFPPPVTFRSSEKHGGIHLAPLAEFLSHLSDASHLIKLADILERFRTPKSYHRYDLRIVDSSELPPSPGAEGHDEELRALWRRERGSPIILDDDGQGEGARDGGHGELQDHSAEGQGGEGAGEAAPNGTGAIEGAVPSTEEGGMTIEGVSASTAPPESPPVQAAASPMAASSSDKVADALPGAQQGPSSAGAPHAHDESVRTSIRHD